MCCTNNENAASRNEDYDKDTFVCLGNICRSPVAERRKSLSAGRDRNFPEHHAIKVPQKLDRPKESTSFWSVFLWLKSRCSAPGAMSMARDGVMFYRSENGVWLCEYVPPEYFCVAEPKRDEET